jgi:hypothetical protein
MRALAPKKIPAEFAFELVDRAGERGLGNVAFFRRSREVERARDSQEITYLVHFHRTPPAIASLLLLRTPRPPDA